MDYWILAFIWFALGFVVAKFWGAVADSGKPQERIGFPDLDEHEKLFNQPIVNFEPIHGEIAKMKDLVK